MGTPTAKQRSSARVLVEHHERPRMRTVHCMQARLLTSSPLLRVTNRGRDFLRPIVRQFGWEERLDFLPHSENVKEELRNERRRPTEQRHLREVVVRVTRKVQGTLSPEMFVDRFVDLLRSRAAAKTAVGKALSRPKIRAAIAEQLEEYGVDVAHFERVLGAYVVARGIELKMLEAKKPQELSPSIG